MKTYIRNTTALCLILALSACGGSNDGSSAMTVDFATSNYAEIAMRGDAILNDPEWLEFTPEADIPVSGSASYVGVTGISEEENNGDLSFAALIDTKIDVEFSNSGSLLDVSVGNFYEVDVAAIGDNDENLGDLSGTAITGSYSFDEATNISTVELTKLNGDATTYTFGQADIIDYFGDDAKYLDVEVDATSSTDGQDDVDAFISFSGTKQ